MVMEDPIVLTGGGHGAVISYGGTNVLCNIGAGWGYEMTPAELAKKMNFILCIGMSIIRLKMIWN